MKLPPYAQYPKIDSAPILLRQVQTNDLPSLIEISFYDGNQATSLEDAIAFQNQIDQDYYEGSTIHWGIVDKSTNVVVGTLGYYRGFANGTGELGCILHPAFRGKGWMKEAMKLAITFGLNDIGLSKIIAITTRQNHNAIKLLERLNFEKTLDFEEDKIEYQLIVEFFQK